MITYKIKELEIKTERLLESKFLSFDEVASLKNKMGVYLIYEGDIIVYIGKTNKFNVRFGTDLKHESTHTLVQKLIKSNRFENRIDVLKYFKTECKIRIEFCDTNREAEALEALAIYILNPLFNKM
jgi:hypothetical protein